MDNNVSSKCEETIEVLPFILEIGLNCSHSILKIAKCFCPLTRLSLRKYARSFSFSESAAYFFKDWVYHLPSHCRHMNLIWLPLLILSHSLLVISATWVLLKMSLWSYNSLCKIFKWWLIKSCMENIQSNSSPNTHFYFIVTSNF